MNILLTSGGTKEMIDRVRHIGNMSSGTFGAAIARQLLQQMPWSDNLMFLRAKDSKSPFSMNINWYDDDSEDQLIRLLELRKMCKKHYDHYKEITYKTVQDYENRLHRVTYDSDFGVIILAAAVSDYLVKNYVDGKIRSSDDMNIELEPCGKFISTMKEENPDAYLVGFKLLVDSTDEELITAAQNSAINNDCGFVVANDLRDIAAGNHRLLLVGKNGLEGTFQSDPKDSEYLAKVVANRIMSAKEQEK